VPVSIDERKFVVVNFPETDESQGNLVLNWVGPAYNEYLVQSVGSPSLLVIKLIKPFTFALSRRLVYSDSI
jgi:hypothetical protein